MPKSSQYHYRTHATIYPNSLHIFSREIEGRTSSSSSMNCPPSYLNTDTQGLISIKAAKRIEKAVTWLIYHSKQKRIFDVQLNKSFTFRINFITLTLPTEQRHTDEEIKRVCLNNWLNTMRVSKCLGEYIWKAETQINGNIHFHLVTDSYIRYDRIQEVWNNSLELLGYITEFERKIGHRHPNSTDVHSVKHVRKITSYISKYMSKNRLYKSIGELRQEKGQTFEILYGSDEYRAEEPNKKRGKVIGHVIAGPCRRIEGKQWYLSRGLSKCKPLHIDEDNFDFREIQKIIQHGNLHFVEREFCHNYYGEVLSNMKKLSPLLYSEFTDHCQKQVQPSETQN